ncbi:hypothetical protein Tco_0809241 [Tanacetum coccineum]
MWGARGGSRGAGEDGGGGVAQSGVVGTGRWEVHLGWGGRGSVRGRVVGDGGGMVGLVRGGVAGLGRRSNAREEVYNMRLSIPRVQIDFLAMQEADCDIDEGSRQTTDPQHTSTTAQPSNEEPITVPSSSQPKKTHIPRKAKRATEISQSSGPISLVADETVTKEREDRIERAATTASSLEA